MKRVTKFSRICLRAGVGLLVAGCLPFQAGAASGENEKPTATGITASAILEHIKVLSSDEFEGRAPGSHGEQLSVDYLVNQFKKLGLQPGNPDGTYIQTVPMVGTRSSSQGISFDANGKALNFAFPDDAVIWSRRTGHEFKVTNSDVVFVGYGTIAPEYDWDDYKGENLSGKTLVMLINDPQIPDPKDPSKLDEAMFKGRAMTYYGRWTYKYDMAAAKGAAAAIIVHETVPAAYPWAVVTNSNGRENFDLQDEGADSGRLAIQGWMTVESARKLFAAGGHDFDELKQSALRRDFHPVKLNSTANLAVEDAQRTIVSRNVVAKVPGSDPALNNEYIVYSAHWDHLGRDTNLVGDQIYNGAVDNASGCAALLELARAFVKSKPKRTVVFLSFTGEEKGLLGSKYYVTHPLYPLERTLAEINIDGINVWGRTRDLSVVGVGQSTLEDTLGSLASASGRVLEPEPAPEKGFYFRSDHFEFARQGVPALFVNGGIDYVSQSKDFGRRKLDEYIAKDYHRVSDEIKPDWDLSGAVEDVDLLYQTGLAVAQGGQWPEWKPGSEFKARREEMLRQK